MYIGLISNPDLVLGAISEYKKRAFIIKILSGFERKNELKSLLTSLKFLEIRQ